MAEELKKAANTKAAAQVKPVQPVAKSEEAKANAGEVKSVDVDKVNEADDAEIEVLSTKGIAEDKPDMVVASVKNRYTLNLGKRKVVHEVGIHTMLREEAEHPFAKIRGTLIVGTPETGTLNDYHTKERLSDAIVKSKNLVESINSLATHLTDLTDNQKKSVTEALEFAEKAFQSISSLGN